LRARLTSSTDTFPLHGALPICGRSVPLLDRLGGLGLGGRAAPGEGQFPLQLREALVAAPDLPREAVHGRVDLVGAVAAQARVERSEEHTSELQSRENLVCRLLL